MKSRLAVGLLLGCLVAAAGCSSSSSSPASPATTKARPTATSTAKNFQVSTPNGQVSLSLNGQLPPNWPSQFPVPPGAKVAGSGSLGGSSSATLVGAYTTSQAPPDAFAFYTNNAKLTTSNQKTAGTGAGYVGSAKITAPYTGSVTVISHSGTTYIVIVLTSSPRSSPSASPTTSQRLTCVATGQAAEALGSPATAPTLGQQLSHSSHAATCRSARKENAAKDLADKFGKSAYECLRRLAVAGQVEKPSCGLCCISQPARRRAKWAT